MRSCRPVGTWAGDACERTGRVADGTKESDSSNQKVGVRVLRWEDWGRNRFGVKRKKKVNSLRSNLPAEMRREQTDVPTERLSRVRTCHRLQGWPVREGRSGDKDHLRPDIPAGRRGADADGRGRPAARPPRDARPLVAFNIYLLLPAELLKKKKKIRYCSVLPAHYFFPENYLPFVFDLHRNLLLVFI